jgi:hypothetical protein
MPAGNTYEAIATTTLGSANDTVTFSSIPSTYTDLILVSNVIPTSSPYIFYRINSDSGSNYSRTQLIGNGTSASSGRFSNESYMYVSTTTISGSSTFISQFQNYSNTTTNKTVLTRQSDAGGNVSAIVSLWRSTAAINNIVVTTTGYSTFAAGSTFSLYGIASA